MEYIEILKKHGLELCDGAKMTKYKISIKNTLGGLEANDVFVPYDIVFRICQSTGTDLDDIPYFSEEEYSASDFLLNLLDLGQNVSNIKDFIGFLALLSIVLQDKHFSSTDYISMQKAAYEGLDKFCLPYYIQDGVIIPKGEKLFDDGLVIDVIEWLSKYPKTHALYLEGIQQYFNKNILVADTLRKSLEIFLQEFLSNSANLETNIPRIGEYLKNQSVENELRCMLTTLITHYKKYNDKKDKHHEASDPKLWEFLLYQTGLFIRMIITVKNAEV